VIRTLCGIRIRRLLLINKEYTPIPEDALSQIGEIIGLHYDYSIVGNVCKAALECSLCIYEAKKRRCQRLMTICREFEPLT